MKILLIGGSGTIGKKVNLYLSEKHEVLIAGRKSGKFKVDIADSKSIELLFQKTGILDAIICCAGEAKWAPFQELSEEDFYIGIKSKMMGQINLVRIGLNYLNPKGSITLSTGILADHPVPMTTSAAMVNGAIHSFVKALPRDMKTEHRVNVVSSGLVEDAAEKYADYFEGQAIIPMAKVVAAYVESVEGSMTGKIIRLY